MAKIDIKESPRATSRISEVMTVSKSRKPVKAKQIADVLMQNFKLQKISAVSVSHSEFVLTNVKDKKNWRKRIGRGHIPKKR